MYHKNIFFDFDIKDLSLQFNYFCFENVFKVFQICLLLLFECKIDFLFFSIFLVLYLDLIKHGYFTKF